MKRLRKGMLLFLLGCLLCSLAGCKGEINCSSLLLTFADAYGIEGEVYTSESRPGEPWYLSDEMLLALYGEEVPTYRSAAVLLCSDLYTVRECGIFVCEDRDDALTSAALFDRRARLLYAYDSEAEGRVLSFGRVVVYFVVPDARRAYRIWRQLL